MIGQSPEIRKAIRGYPRLACSIRDLRALILKWEEICDGPLSRSLVSRPG
jgi:hypothetical protein